MAPSFIWMMFLLFLLCPLALRDPGVASQNITSSTFVDYGTEPPNCTKSSEMSSYISCALSCMSRTECQAFRFETDDQSCTACIGEDITKLTFSGQPFFYRRRQTVHNATELTLSRTLVPGDLIYLSVTPYEAFGVALNLQHSTLNRKALHLTVRLNQRRVNINSFDDNKWLNDKYVSSLFSFALGKRSDVHILMTHDRFMIYFDREFCCDYLYLVPLEDMGKIRIMRIAQIHELSC